MTMEVVAAWNGKWPKIN